MRSGGKPTGEKKPAGRAARCRPRGAPLEDRAPAHAATGPAPGPLREAFAPGRGRAAGGVRPALPAPGARPHHTRLGGRNWPL